MGRSADHAPGGQIVGARAARGSHEEGCSPPRNTRDLDGGSRRSEKVASASRLGSPPAWPSPKRVREGVFAHDRSRERRADREHALSERARGPPGGARSAGPGCTPSMWRTGANIEAKLLMLEHAFERLGCMRVGRSPQRAFRAATSAARAAGGRLSKTGRASASGDPCASATWHDAPGVGVPRRFQAASRQRCMARRPRGAPECRGQGCGRRLVAGATSPRAQSSQQLRLA